MRSDTALEDTSTSAPLTVAPPLEVLEVLTDEARGRSGNVPPRLIAAHAIRVTSGGDFPLQKAALDALLRRLGSAREQDGFVIRSKPRGASPFGLYRLQGRHSSREYRVLFRFRDPPQGSCECADFARNALGLCKHLLWLLDLSFASGPKRNAPVAREVAMIIADSDVLIDFLRGRGDWARRVAIELQARSFAATAITAFEIRSGARTTRQKKAVDTLLEAMTVLPFGSEEARIAAEIRHQLEKQGEPIGMADYMIAAVCIAASGVLLTRNRKHFERIKGLQLSGQTSGER
jgi:tRNA(fMet)-specific endonuclease VapC